MPLAPKFILHRWRFHVLLLALAIMFIWLGSRLYWLHIHEAEYLQEVAASARVYERRLHALRGEITDCNANVLAQSQFVWDIVIDPFDAAGKLNEIINSRYKKEIIKTRHPSERQKDAARAKATSEAMAENAEKIQWLARLLKEEPRQFAEKTSLRWKIKPLVRTREKKEETKAAIPAKGTPARALEDSWASWFAKICRRVCSATGLVESYHKRMREMREKTERRHPPLTKPPFEGAEPAFRHVLLANGVNLDVKKVVEARKIPGVRCIQRAIRTYPSGFIASQIVGMADAEQRTDGGGQSPKNNKGRKGLGLEKGMNEWLSPTDGTLISEQKNNEEIPWRRKQLIPPTPGMRVETTLDKRIQEICEEQAAAAAALYKPEGIVIIVSEPSTGKIRAFANWPSFNPITGTPLGELSEASKKRDLYRIAGVSDKYEPGSVFKIIPFSVVINEGIVSPEEQFDTKSNLLHFPVRYRGIKRDLVREKGEPMKNIQDMVKHSSNRGTVLALMRLTEQQGGEKLFANYMELFGIGSRTGIYEPIGLSEAHEPKGDIPKLTRRNNDWEFADPTAITRVPDGHGVHVTPLQMHFAMSVIANEGKLMKPMLVERIVKKKPRDESLGDEYEEEIFIQNKPVLRQTPIKATTARQLAQYLRGVFLPKGTGESGECPGYEPAGKTGTAQRKLEDGEVRINAFGKKVTYSNTNWNVTLSGFFPFETPLYVVSVIIFDPRAPNNPAIGCNKGAGAICGPVFKNIVEKMGEILAIPKAEPRLAPHEPR
ncbi:MAG: hypothetical protein LBG65_05540 [Puniceicoccales bacterium]|jgi:cell division protein FtsI/penicillin-binding protein 2|nr:hypothetical protein [Puniceicoccales bacterium]